MNLPAAADELERSYEALRAQAIGTCPPATPRGLALLLSSGLPTWMAACGRAAATATSHRMSSTAPSARPPASVSLSSDLVRVLTEMAVGRMRMVHA